ncbi:MAG: signal peptide peptidase SppA [Bacteriovoracaceae bacterium]|nr:signal peptide peptidase SppA [Bacteriovoracaceae bacterium]
MQSESKTFMSVLILVFVLFSLLIGTGIYFFNRVQQDVEGEMTSAHEKESIAVVEVQGVIMDPQKIIEHLKIAEEDNHIVAILLKIDSPGGAVGPVQEIYEEIRRINKIKPVYASFGLIAASGGYYIGAATRKIFTNAGTLTGSIGVIFQFADLSKLYEFVKISFETIKGGTFKDMGGPHRKLTEEEKGLLKKMIERVHAQFKNHILEGRKERIKGNLDEYAQGQIFSGEEAVEVGLADEIAGLWESARRIHKELGLKNKLNVHFIKQKKKFSVLNLLDEVEESVTGIRERVTFDMVPLLVYKK